MSDTITSTIRLTVIKPLDGDWNALGQALRALSRPLHRVLNATVRELEVKRDVKAWLPTPGDLAKGRDRCHPRTAVYRFTSSVWEEERKAARERVADGKRVYIGDEAIAETTPMSAVVLGVAGAAFARWSKFDKERWKGSMSLPSFRDHSPIYVAGQGVKVYAQDGNIVLDLSLVEGGRTRLIVNACDGDPSGYAKLRRLLESPEGVGDVRLIEEDDRRLKRKWFAMIAFTEPRRVAELGRTIAVHRGVRSFLSVSVTRSDEKKHDAFSTVLETGDDILKHKEAYRSRRRSLGQQGRQLGMGAKGHGVARRHERITRVEDAEARWVRSKCQETAAHLFATMTRFGATRILLEDWTNPAKDGAPELGEFLEYRVRSFPLAQLRETIEWGAKRRGFSVDVVRTDNNSRDCPACGHHHDTAQVGSFMCSNCKLERNVDVIFAWNMLKRDGHAPGIEETKRAIKKVKPAKVSSRA